MEAYYRERAREYDKIYRAPEWQDDLAWLKSWLRDATEGRTVLELAAGTAYWTEAAARAKAIVATDYNPEMLALAAKRSLGAHVALITADAYSLPKFDNAFDVGMAHLWWSHVKIQSQQEFLRHFASRLEPGATLLMIDQLYCEESSYPAFKRDQFGNRYELRILQNGKSYEVVKNYPTVEELKNAMAGFCEEIDVTKLHYFWALRARLRVGADWPENSETSKR